MSSMTDTRDDRARAECDGRNGQESLDPRAIVGLPAPPANMQRMYAITFDLDTDTLQQVYPGDSWRNAYTEIRRILIDGGFAWQQGSVYFGDPERIDAVTCVVTAQRLARDLPWFTESVRDIRMLRIEENNDLGPAVDLPRR
jgi:virulence-associated protein VapD